MPMSREKLKKRFERADVVVTELAKQARKRVTIDPDVMDGQPCVRGVPVSAVVRFLSQEYSIESLLAAWPGMTREDIHAALSFAADELIVRYTVEPRQ